MCADKSSASYYYVDISFKNGSTFNASGHSVPTPTLNYEV